MMVISGTYDEVKRVAKASVRTPVQVVYVINPSNGLIYNFAQVNPSMRYFVDVPIGATTTQFLTDFPGAIQVDDISG